MKIKKESASCSRCGKGQIVYKKRKLCNRCYQAEWAKNYYHKNQKEMSEKSKLWQREKKKKLGKRLPIIDNLWSQKYDCCIKCGKTKFRHYCKGLCSSCFYKKRYPKKHKKYLEKLYSNKDFHQKELKKFREWNTKQYIKNPERIKKMNIKSYYKNKDKISKKNKEKYSKKRKQLRKEKKIFCQECNKKFEPYFLNGGKERFCSETCRYDNWYRLNKKINKVKQRIYVTINNNKKRRYDKEFRLINIDKKKEIDKRYYCSNYKKIREVSRIREILRGRLLSFNRKDFEEIMNRDISLLKKIIEVKQKELNELDSQSYLITKLIKKPSNSDITN